MGKSTTTKTEEVQKIAFASQSMLAWQLSEIVAQMTNDDATAVIQWASSDEWPKLLVLIDKYRVSNLGLILDNYESELSMQSLKILLKIKSYKDLSKIFI